MSVSEAGLLALGCQLLYVLMLFSVHKHLPFPHSPTPASPTPPPRKTLFNLYRTWQVHGQAFPLQMQHTRAPRPLHKMLPAVLFMVHKTGNQLHGRWEGTGSTNTVRREYKAIRKNEIDLLC